MDEYYHTISLIRMHIIRLDGDDKTRERATLVAEAASDQSDARVVTQFI